MRSAITFCLLFIMPFFAVAQTIKQDFAGCGNHTFTAIRKGNDLFLQEDAKRPVKIGTDLTAPQAEKAYRAQLKTALDNLCTTPATYAAAIAFRLKFPPEIIAGLFKAKVSTVRKTIEITAITMLDDTHYFALSITPEKKFLVVYGDNTTVTAKDILSWNDGNKKYEFQFANFGAPLVQAHLPELLELLETKASIKQPTLYLKDKGDATFSIVAADNSTDGTVSSVTAIPAETADLIKVPGSEVKMKLDDGKKYDLRQIKRTAGVTAEATPKAIAKPATNKGQLIAQRQVACTNTTSFHIFAYQYKPAPADSVLIVIRTGGNKNTEFIVPLDWSSDEFTGFIRSDQFKNACIREKTNNDLPVFFMEYTSRLPYLAAPPTIKAATPPTITDSSKKDTTAAPAVKDSARFNIAALAGQTDFAALLQLRGKKILLDMPCSDRQEQGEGKSLGPDTNNYLDIDSVVIQVFNNNIHQVDVVGRINGKPVQTVSNANWGMGLRTFIDASTYIKFGDDLNPYRLYYCQLFFVRPTAGDAISYVLADGKYSFFPDSPRDRQKVVQKKLLDFISLNAFVDLQSLGQSSTNKNILTELYFNWPVHNNNAGKKTWLKYLYLNATLGFNLFNNETSKVHAYYLPDSVFRTIPVANTNPVQYKPDTLLSPAYYLKNFDLIRNAFVTARPMLNLWSLDLKNANTLVELNGGFNLMGSTIKYIDKLKGVDSASSQTLFSYGYQLETRIRINPKVNYGLDFHFSWNRGQQLLTHDFRSVTGNLNTETLVKSNMLTENKRSFIQAELNFYFNPKDPKTSTDRGGFFVKLNLLKSNHYDDGQFMFLVGYSSDIKNFFK